MSLKDPINPLYSLVLRAAQSGKFDEASEADFVDFVRGEYLDQMKRLGQPLPTSFTEGIDREIRDSLKALIYGFFSLKEYNLRRQR
jgi:hypothetical protein